MTCTYGELSKLGFGFMRLPTVEVDGEKVIDIELVKEMADLFMDAGFTYFDTARGYHGGKSEAALRERGAKLFDDFDLWNFLREKKEAGLIRDLGFSIHDKAAVLDDVSAAHPEVDFMQTLSDSARARSAEMGRRAQGHEAFALCEPSGKALER